MHTHCDNVLILFYYFSVLYVNIFSIHLNLTINMYFIFTCQNAITLHEVV
jgi:hypothetical protein